MLRKIALGLTLSAALLLFACPDKNKAEAEQPPAAPKLNKTQEDIAHAPRRTLDNVERAGDRAEKATEARVNKAAAAMEEE